MLFGCQRTIRSGTARITPELFNRSRLYRGEAHFCHDFVSFTPAQAHGVSLREWRSVLENLEFIRVLIRSQWSKSLQAAVMQALMLIYRGLEFFVDGGGMVNPPQSERQRSRRAKK
jgi:hypothetical protein